MADSYPVNLSIDYPDRKLNRLTSFFRIFTVIPIAIILILLIGTSNSNISRWENWSWGLGIGVTVLPLILMILFRRKYPRWWYDWNLEMTKFIYRVEAYLYLMTDVYPSTDEEQTVHVELPYPDASKLRRGLPLVKWFLAIPHIIVLAFLCIAAMVVAIISWFAILFTGKYPRDLFKFVLDVARWSLRVTGYALVLVTDQYPPFRLGV
jgi:hypothetical protein